MTFDPQVWDQELATLAMFWAVNCEVMSNENRHEQSSEFDYVGENMGATRNYTYNLTALVGQWFERGKNYNYYTLTCQEEEEEDEMDRRRRRQEDDEDDICQPYTQVRGAAHRERGGG